VPRWPRRGGPGRPRRPGSGRQLGVAQGHAPLLEEQPSKPPERRSYRSGSCSSSSRQITRASSSGAGPRQVGGRRPDGDETAALQGPPKRGVGRSLRSHVVEHMFPLDWDGAVPPSRHSPARGVCGRRVLLRHEGPRRGGSSGNPLDRLGSVTAACLGAHAAALASEWPGRLRQFLGVVQVGGVRARCPRRLDAAALGEAIGGLCEEGMAVFA
jgi:hypothetical protein